MRTRIFIVLLALTILGIWSTHELVDIAFFTVDPNISPAELAAARSQTNLLLTKGALIALILAITLAWLLPKLITRSQRELLRMARLLAAGELEARTYMLADPRDPLAPLGRALDQIATNLRNMVDDLRTQRDLVGRILERMEEGILVLDKERRITLINPAVRSMLLPKPNLVAKTPAIAGRTGEMPSLLDVRGHAFLEVFRHADLISLLDQARQDKRARGEIETEGIRPRRLQVTVIRFSKAPGGYLLVFVDVTEIRRLESLRRDFVANVSHELRTPVASIRSAAETVTDAIENDREAAAHFCAIINRNAERLQNLVQDLLDLSKIESREYKLKLESLPLGREVAHIFEMFRGRAESRHIDLRAEVPDDAMVRVDRRGLETILSNLIDNALKYCPEGSQVRVSFERHDKEVRISVRDSGQGIEPQHLPRLFERFYRVDPGRSRDRGGTGLGLSIVKHLAEAMGGTAQVTSTVGEGTTFTLVLPHEPRATVRSPASDASAAMLG